SSVFLLIEFIIGNKVVHAGIRNPTLMRVGSTSVSRTGNDLGRGLDRNVIDSERILIKAEADFLSLVGSRRALIDNILSVVDVTVRGGTAEVLGGGRLRNVEHVQASGAHVSTNCIYSLCCLVGNDVVAVAEAIVEG